MPSVRKSALKRFKTPIFEYPLKTGEINKVYKDHAKKHAGKKVRGGLRQTERIADRVKTGRTVEGSIRPNDL